MKFSNIITILSLLLSVAKGAAEEKGRIISFKCLINPDATRALKSNTTIESLDFTGCEMGDGSVLLPKYGICNIASLIKTHPELKCLLLGGNEIGQSGATALIQTLPDLINLETLDLSSNSGIDLYWTPLFEVLPPSLKKIDLSYCRIKKEHFPALGRLVQRIPELKIMTGASIQPGTARAQ